jgi:hypothetical protein
MRGSRFVWWRSDDDMPAPGRRRRHSTTRATLVSVVAATTVSSGCYRYVPNAQANFVVGEEVRVRLTSDGAATLLPVVGADVAAIDGRITARTDTAYGLSVGGTLKRAGTSAVWSGESITVPITAIAGVDRRVLDTRKTALVSGLAVGVGALAALVISAVTGGGSTGSDPGTTPP